MMKRTLLRLALTRTGPARFASAEHARKPAGRACNWADEIEQSRMESGEWARDSYGMAADSSEQHMQLELTILKRAFSEFDLDKNGVLDREEIAAALEMLGVDSSVETVDRIFADYDENGDGFIDLDEWLSRESEDLRTRIFVAFKDKCDEC